MHFVQSMATVGVNSRLRCPSFVESSIVGRSVVSASPPTAGRKISPVACREDSYYAWCMGMWILNKFSSFFAWISSWQERNLCPKLYRREVECASVPQSEGQGVLLQGGCAIVLHCVVLCDMIVGNQHRVKMVQECISNHYKDQRLAGARLQCLLEMK